MSAEHLEQVLKYYEGRLPFPGIAGTTIDSLDVVMTQLSMASFDEIPVDDICVAHMSGFHHGPGKSVQVFVTDKAIQLVHTGVFKKEKILGSERIRPESITGAERQRGGMNATKGAEWTVVISRSVEQDSISNLSDADSSLLLEKIEEIKNSATGGSNKAPAESPAETLLKLKGLLDVGAITNEEFEAKKVALLEKM
jgi:hypothetical protein